MIILYTDLSGRELSVKLENIRFRVSQNMKVCFSAAKTEDDVAREYAIVQANDQKLNVVTVMKEKTVLRPVPIIRNICTFCFSADHGVLVGCDGILR